LIGRALFLLFVAFAPAFCAEMWTLPLFTSDPAQVYDAAQEFTPPKNTDVYLIDVDVTLAIDSAWHLSNKRLVVARIATDAGTREFAKLVESWLAWRQNESVLHFG
jgi:hypothetical protein